MSWTDDRVDLLKKLWGEGKTAAEIAKQLGGVTRNAVIGKAHRLKLSNRVSPIQQNRKPKVQVPRKVAKASNDSGVIKKAPTPVKSSLPEVKGGKSLLDLKAGECRWPQGDPQEKEFGFCADNCVPGLPYCATHAKAAYQAARKSINVGDVDAPRKTRMTEEQEAEMEAVKKSVSA